MKYITGSSYLTKLIVDPFGKEKIRHITVPGRLLGNYDGWNALIFGHSDICYGWFIVFEYFFY